ncbi:hypothetical protein CCHL11_08996 [Colletotrichum chlorophyti]|uniref:Uncharacterized protein n=1 Tax=Colletotrichum chlorophyti TaxID=708187 RepID=A0A1Q8RWW1_9PEZI|nr:hypothetical protein CCHL11_08996 [Colletotrichum chlorophyti]
MNQFKEWTHETQAAVLDEVSAARDDVPERAHPRQPPPGHSSGHEDVQVERTDSSPRCPSYQWNPLPGFAHVDGDVKGPGYNDTFVDIVCVPCPGADPVETWARDPLPDGFFGRPEVVSGAVRELVGASILSPTANRYLPQVAHLWVRQGIRKEVSLARVLLYRHRELVEGVTLHELADDLIEQVWSMRHGEVRVGLSSVEATS